MLMLLCGYHWLQYLKLYINILETVKKETFFNNEEFHKSETMLFILFDPEDRRRILLVIGLLSLFMFIIFTFIFLFHLYLEDKLITRVLSPFVKYYVEFFILIATLGFGVGAITAYLMMSKVKKVREVAWASTEIMLSFFQPEERIIVDYLLNHQAPVKQYDISHLHHLNKVKAHRILRKLRERRIVDLQRVGKVNSVMLRKEIREAFGERQRSLQI